MNLTCCHSSHILIKYQKSLIKLNTNNTIKWGVQYCPSDLQIIDSPDPPALLLFFIISIYSSDLAFFFLLPTPNPTKKKKFRLEFKALTGLLQEKDFAKPVISQ